MGNWRSSSPEGGQAKARPITLGDIDWERNRIQFRRRKTQQLLYVPIYNHLRPGARRSCPISPEYRHSNILAASGRIDPIAVASPCSDCRAELIIHCMSRACAPRTEGRDSCGLNYRRLGLEHRIRCKNILRQIIEINGHQGQTRVSAWFGAKGNSSHTQGKRSINSPCSSSKTLECLRRNISGNGDSIRRKRCRASHPLQRLKD